MTGAWKETNDQINRVAERIPDPLATATPSDHAAKAEQCQRAWCRD